MSRNHTPTPWREYKDGIHPILTDGIEKNAHHAICAEFFGPDAVLNRAFIVRACNAHDDLVAALEGFLKFDQDFQKRKQALQFAIETLAKAKAVQ